MFDMQASTQPWVSHSDVAHSKMRHATSWPPRKRIPSTPEEDATLVKMKEDNCSWEEVSAALSSMNLGGIQVHYSTKFSSGATRSRKRQRLWTDKRESYCTICLDRADRPRFDGVGPRVGDTAAEKVRAVVNCGCQLASFFLDTKQYGHPRHT
jgi:hypothetical protein